MTVTGLLGRWLEFLKIVVRSRPAGVSASYIGRRCRGEQVRVHDITWPRETRSGRRAAAGGTESLSSYTESLLPWPPSVHLTQLASPHPLTFQFPETCRGPKAQRRLYTFKISSARFLRRHGHDLRQPGCQTSSYKRDP